MNNDIIITPASASIRFSGSAISSIALRVEASGSLNFVGSSGSLLSIEDNLSGSLFSVSDVSGLPSMEVFSDDSVNIGRFNAYAIQVKPLGKDVSLGSGSVMFVSSSGKVGVGSNTPVNTLDIIGNVSASVITASLLFGTASNAGTSSWAVNVLGSITNATYATSASWVSAYALTSSYAITSGSVVSSSYSTTSSFSLTSSYAITTGSVGYLPYYKTNASLSSSIIYFDGTQIGIGTASPAQGLDVSKNVYFQTTVGIGTNSTSETLTVKGSLNLDLTVDATSRTFSGNWLQIKVGATTYYLELWS
jgi:hypothetical protein